MKFKFGGAVLVRTIALTFYTCQIYAYWTVADCFSE